MDKYRLVEEHKAEESQEFLAEASPDTPEVRITQQGKPRNYISYALNLFVSRNGNECTSSARSCISAAVAGGARRAPQRSGITEYVQSFH